MVTTSSHQIVKGVRCPVLAKLWACYVVGTSLERCASFWFSAVEVEQMTPLRRRGCDRGAETSAPQSGAAPLSGLIVGTSSQSKPTPNYNRTRKRQEGVSNHTRSHFSRGEMFRSACDDAYVT